MSRLPFVAVLLSAACQAGSSHDDPGHTDVSGHTDGPATLSAVVQVPGGPPAPGIRILFHDAEGTLLASEVTDAEGRAQTIATGTGSVTAVANDQFLMVLGLVPGDEVRFAARAPADDSPDPTTTVTASPNPDLVNWEVTAGCTEIGPGTLGSRSPDVPTAARCRYGSDRIDLFAFGGLDGVGGAWNTVLDVSADEPVTLPDAWRTDWAIAEVQITDPPASLSGIGAGMHLRRRGLRFVERTGGIAVGGSSRPSFQVQTPKGFAEDTLIHVSLRYDRADGPDTNAAYLEVVDGDPPPVFALAGADLPLVAEEASMDATVAKRPRLTWSGGSGEAMTVVSVVLLGNGATGLWSFFVEGDATEVQVPELPDDLADYRPRKAQNSVVRVRKMSVDGLTPHELVRDWSVLAGDDDFSALGDRLRRGRWSELEALPP